MTSYLTIIMKKCPHTTTIVLRPHGDCSKASFDDNGMFSIKTFGNHYIRIPCTANISIEGDEMRINNFLTGKQTIEDFYQSLMRQGLPPLKLNNIIPNRQIFVNETDEHHETDQHVTSVDNIVQQRKKMDDILQEINELLCGIEEQCFSNNENLVDVAVCVRKKKNQLGLMLCMPRPFEGQKFVLILIGKQK